MLQGLQPLITLLLNNKLGMQVIKFNLDMVQHIKGNISLLKAYIKSISCLSKCNVMEFKTNYMYILDRLPLKMTKKLPGWIELVICWISVQEIVETILQIMLRVYLTNNSTNKVANKVILKNIKRFTEWYNWFTEPIPRSILIVAKFTFR